MTSGGNAADSPSSGELTWVGNTVALPPPSTLASLASAPISATRRSDDGSSGSAPPRFAASTNDRTAIWRASSAPSTGSGLSSGGTASAVPDSVPTLAASRRTRATCSSMTSAGTMPWRTASASRLPHGLPLAGMTTSRPPFAVPAVSRAAIQSETTTPSKPHSPPSTPVCNAPLVVIGMPLTALYADMTAQAPASRTSASNGARYSSRRARSLTCVLAVNRSVS